MKPIFVTAAGTDVGKTYVTAGIIRALRAQGRPANAIKPVMSGYDPNYPASSDAGVLLEAMGKPVNAETVSAIAPWRFTAPLSPDMAAAKEGRDLSLGDILRFTRTAIQASSGALLVEGVGGAMVPLNGRHTVRDWICGLNIPCLLVTGSYLGSISHALTAASCLRQAAVRIAAIVISESTHSPVPLAETAHSMGRFLPGIPLHLIPRDLNDLSFFALADFISDLRSD